MDFALGLILIVLGAILAFAVRNEPSGLDLDALGWILMLAGLFLVGWSLAWWGRHRFLRVTERVMSPSLTRRRIIEPKAPAASRRRIMSRSRIIERMTPERRPHHVDAPPPADRVVEHETPSTTDKDTDTHTTRNLYDNDTEPTNDGTPPP